MGWGHVYFGNRTQEGQGQIQIGSDQMIREHPTVLLIVGKTYQVRI